MEEKDLLKLINKLRGLKWCFMAGFAIEIYTNGERKAGEDVDILISPKDIEIFAKRIGCQVERRHFKKSNFFVNDFGFEINFGRLKIEVSSGFPPKRIKDGLINKVFQKRILKKYRGIYLWVEPIEEIIVHKATMFREKDIKDLNLLKREKIDFELLKEFARDYGKYWYNKILKNLKILGIL